MIEPIRHYAIIAHATVHDEEALTSLELNGRTAAKVNEVVEDVNAQRKEMEAAIDGIPQNILDSLEQMEQDGSLAGLINDTLLATTNNRLSTMETRINNILVSGTPTEGNAELIDARTGAAGQAFSTLGAHIRAIANGTALNDALKPGTIRHGRISAGMLMGELARRYVIGEQWTTAGKWAGSGYVDPSTLEVISHTGYSFTAPFPCEYGDTFRVYTAIYGNKIPAAIFYDSNKRIIGTSGGDIGQSDWVPRYHYVQVDNSAAYIAFQCGSAYTGDFRVLRYSARMYPDPLEAMGGRGYIRAYAFNRTDTVTDRAQVKMWFPVQEGKTYRLRLEPLIFRNCKGWTVRYFAASNDSSYSRSLPESDHGRTYAASLAIASDITIPAHGEDEQPFTHMAVFVDLLANDVNSRVDATFAPPTLYTVDGNTVTVSRVDPVNVTLHGTDTGSTSAYDYVAVVPAGGMASPCWRKTIQIEGDSLAKGNTLPETSSWFNLACSSRDMFYMNDAVNGQAISDIPDKDWTGLDYFVLQGGANDKRLNKPLAGFRDRIKSIVEKVRRQSPKCKILCMTNWRRTTSPNDIGLYDYDYVAAMLEVCEEIGAKCVNNYADSLNLLDPYVAAWADEGYVSTGTTNIHFSVEANKWLAPRFLAALENL